MIKWCLMGAILPVAVAQAASEFGATPSEQAMCQAVIYDGRDTSDRANWGHMHHFCDCVRFTNRAITKSGAERAHEVSQAIDGCDYVLSHTTPDFNMRGDVHLQKGRALNILRKGAQASSEFVKALSVNPGLIPAYVALSDHYARLGIRKEALNFAVEGLKRAPNSRVLQRRYTELGGTLPFPFPEPLKREPLAVPEVAPEPAAPGVDAQQPNVTPADDKKMDAAPSGNTPAADSAVAAPPAPAPTDASPIIGTPDSPWCRFCPPP